MKVAKLDKNEVNFVFEKLKSFAYRAVSASKTNLSDLKNCWRLSMYSK